MHNNGQMNKEDVQRFKQVLLATYELIDNRREISELAFGLWLDAMKTYDIKTIQQAFSTYIKTPEKGQFVPKPADIVQIISGTFSENSMQAWSKVVKAISAAGMYATVVFDDPVIHLVIRDMGGWISLCQTEEDELKFRGHEFSNRYKAYKGAGRLPAYPKKLYGIAESENSAKGVEHYDKIKFIGDPSKAQYVLESGANIKSLLISDGEDVPQRLQIDFLLEP